MLFLQLFLKNLCLFKDEWGILPFITEKWFKCKKKQQHLYPYSDKGLKGTGVTRHPLSGRSFEVTSTVLKVKNIYIYCSGKSEHSEAKPAL